MNRHQSVGNVSSPSKLITEPLDFFSISNKKRSTSQFPFGTNTEAIQKHTWVGLALMV